MISVIVPARNAAATLSECLKALTCQEHFSLGKDYEILLVDDGSSDQTPNIGREWGVCVISQPNAGPAAARNTGAKHAAGEILAFTDADCIPLPDWLEKLTSPFADPGIIGIKGAYRCIRHEIVARFVQIEYEYKYQRMQKFERIDFIDTYSAAYRRKEFLDNGGFNPIFTTPSVEDQELSFRLARKGYRMVFASKAKVVHRHDLTIGEYARRKWGIGYWKAVLLNWLPEKFLSDSHTSPSQRWQILLLFTGLFLTSLGLVWPFLFWGSLACAAGFLLTCIPFLLFIFNNDPKLILPGIGLLGLRAAALGGGLVGGFIFPPRMKKRLGIGPNLLEAASKRLADIIFSVTGLALFSPLLALSALGIRVSSQGPALFSQTRAGLNGKIFKIYKLRTMKQDAANQLEQLIDVDGLEEPSYKIQDDPRVTLFGRFLRRWSIDELPQLWNVLRGDMSLVGPRPEETWLVERYTDAQRQRLAVKPGLTGPMQVSGRGLLRFSDRLELELDYIENYSLWRDCKIILRSIPAVISGKGAF